MKHCPNCGLDLTPDRQPLTKGERRVMDVIERLYMASNNCPPTMREVADVCGYRSLATVHEFTRNLRRKGWLVEPERPGLGSTLVPA